MMKGTQASSSSHLRRGIVLLGLGAILLGAGPAWGQTLYSETFTNSGASSKSVSAFNPSWHSYEGTAATDISSTSSGTNDYTAITATDAYGTGYLAVASATQNYSVVGAFASGFVVPTGSTISWTMGNSKTAATVRLVIQIGGDGSVGSGTWYASTSTFSNTTAVGSAMAFETATSGVAFSLNFTTTASAWQTLTLSPGSTMSLGSNPTSNLASSTITGIGFYVNNQSSSDRIDNLTVTAVPEPSASALLGLGALGLGGLLFRERRRAC